MVEAAGFVVVCSALAKPLPGTLAGECDLTALLVVALLISGLLGGSPQAATPSTETAPTATPSLVALPAAGSAERRMFEALNAERVKQGLTPVAWSSELGTAAALHSAEMAASGYLDHYGLDGSDQQQRAARAGYIVPAGSGWMVIEAVSGQPSLEAALGWMLGDGVHRRVVLRSTWREVGIGYATGRGYGAYWTLDFGCRPNVLPVFADPTGDGQGLKLTFTNENCAAYGGGPDQMGRAVELMLSAYADFRDGLWEPFVDAKQIPRPAASELNVRLRDSSARVSAPQQVSIENSSSGGTLATPTAQATETATPTASVPPTATPTSTPSPTATLAPTATATPTPVPTEESGESSQL